TVSVIGDTLRVGEAPAHGEGNVLKYTSGVAILNSVAFALAHGYTVLTDPSNANGFTAPYRFALYLNALAFILLGLWFIWKLLSNRFGRGPALCTVLAIGLATNLFYFGVINNVMAHPFLFALWAALLYATDRFYRHPGVRWSVAIGLLAGMITLIRPTEIICVLVPFLWEIKSVRARLTLLRRHRKLLMIMAFCLVLCALPQLLYWKYTTGQWVYYSYAGEGFNFLKPRISKGLFSFRNGWLIYTPVMILSMTGMVMLWIRRHTLRMVVTAVVVLHVWLVFSWWNWFYINGFGMRAMVDLYPVLAIPFAAMIAYLAPRWRRWIYGFVILCVLLNVYQTEQHRRGVLWTEDMNSAYYRQSFGRLQMDQAMSVAYDLHTFQTSRKWHTLLWEEDFEGNSFDSAHMVQHDSRAYRITPEAAVDFGEHVFPFASTSFQPGDLLAVSCQVYVEKQISQYYDMTSFALSIKRGERFLARRYLRLNNKPGDPGDISLWWGVPGQWAFVEAHMTIPRSFRAGDEIRISLISPNPESVVYIDDLKVGIVR
ncbi:MAG: glycosyltransferase family 39 protein, partial [Saprospiraceae bacterium]|nr:glycosyltransferase family 39 protein [Saprospiraceae bacterium]